MIFDRVDRIWLRDWMCWTKEADGFIEKYLSVVHGDIGWWWWLSGLSYITLTKGRNWACALNIDRELSVGRVWAISLTCTVFLRY